MYVYTVDMYVYTVVRLYVFMYVRMFVCMYVCIYVCDFLRFDFPSFVSPCFPEPQRGVYSNISTKIAVFRSKLPSIDSLLGRIQRRKKFESFVLAGVVSVCAIVILYFSVLR